MNTENIQKRLRNWKTWVALFPCLVFTHQVWSTRSKTFLDELAPYLLTVGIALGIWSDHEGNGKGDVQ